jgi:hypothetical protein
MASVLERNETNNEKIHNFRRVYVKDPALEEILNSVGRLRTVGHGSTHSHCMGIFGPSGSGKTRLVSYYQRNALKGIEKRTHFVDDVEVETLPILSVECPPRATVKGMAETLLAALGDPKPSRGTQQEMTQRVLSALRVRGVGLIVMDEFQHLAGRTRGHDSAYETADWIKSLLNANICPILLVGTQPAVEILRVNEQLRRRALAVHLIGPYSVSTGSELESFQKVLRGLEEATNLPQPSNLDDEDLARRIHIATGGLIGRITGLLDRALQLTVQRKQESISRSILRDVFKQTEGAISATMNPFSDGYTPIRAELAQLSENPRQLRGKKRLEQPNGLKGILT